MWRSISVVGALLVIASGCSSRAASPPLDRSKVPLDRSKAEESIREVVFKDMLGAGNQKGRWGGKLLFLSTGDRQDPSPELMRRLVSDQVRIKPVSEATIERSEGWVRDKATGERGLILGVHKIRWTDDQTVEIDASVYNANLSAEGWTYKVAWQDGQWVMREKKFAWES